MQFLVDATAMACLQGLFCCWPHHHHYLADRLLWSSPAESAFACCAGDVITGVNNRKVTKAADLAIALDSFNVGDKIVLKVRRGDEGSQASTQSHAMTCLALCL